MNKIAVLLFAALIPLPHTVLADDLEHSIDSLFTELDIPEDIIFAYEYDIQCLECLFPPEWLPPTEEEKIFTASTVISSKDKKNKKQKNSETAIRPVAKGKVISVLGDRRSGGRRHQGVDYGAPMGTSIVAPWNGVVVRKGTNKLGGHIVKLKHPNGFTTYFAHLKSAAIVKEGQLVEQGQTIGYVGMSGNARGTTPHLHFELRNGKKVLNPLKYIK